MNINSKYIEFNYLMFIQGLNEITNAEEIN